MCKSSFYRSFVILASLFILVFSSPIFAAEGGGLGVYPANPDPNQQFGKSWFIYSAEIGKEIKDQVEVTNTSDSRLRAKIWATDGITTDDGAFAPGQEADKRDVGTWISLAENEFDLAPKEKKVIDFVLKVPANAEVGDHMGVIMVRPIDNPLVDSNKKTDKVESSIKIVTQVGARIYLTVPGEMIRSLNFTNFSWEKRGAAFYFTLGLEDLGNVRIEPTGSITIKDILGRKIEELTLPKRAIFPKNKIILPVEWKKPGIGKFTAVAEVSYFDKTITKKINVYLLPSKMAMFSFGLGIILLIALIMIIVVSARKFLAKLTKASRGGGGAPLVVDLRMPVGGRSKEIKKTGNPWLMVFLLLGVILLAGLAVVVKMLFLQK